MAITAPASTLSQSCYGVYHEIDIPPNDFERRRCSGDGCQYCAAGYQALWLYKKDDVQCSGGHDLAYTANSNRMRPRCQYYESCGPEVARVTNLIQLRRSSTGAAVGTGGAWRAPTPAAPAPPTSYKPYVAPVPAAPTPVAYTQQGSVQMPQMLANPVNYALPSLLEAPEPMQDESGERINPIKRAGVGAARAGATGFFQQLAKSFSEMPWLRGK